MKVLLAYQTNFSRNKLKQAQEGICYLRQQVDVGSAEQEFDDDTTVVLPLHCVRVANCVVQWRLPFPILHVHISSSSDVSVHLG